MALPGTSWHCGTEPSFQNSLLITAGYAISRTASEAGGRAFAAKRSFRKRKAAKSAQFESRPGHHLISRTQRTRACEALRIRITEPDRIHFPLPFLRHGSDFLMWLFTTFDLD